MKKIVFGVAGPIGCGKGTVVDWFKDHGFVSISLSDEIRLELINRDLEITRASLQEVGNQLRENLGDSILAQRAWGKINTGHQTKIVIESIRHPDEVRYLQKQAGFYLINVKADQKVRFERIAKRKRSGDSITWEQFLEEDTEEAKGHHGEHGQLVEETAKLADFVVDNSGKIEDTYSALAAILKKVQDA